MRRAYEGFAARPLVLELGAKEGEWLALEAGTKPMVREVLPPEDLGSSMEHWRAAGLSWEVVDGGVERSGAGHLGRGGPRRVVFVGRDRAALREAAALEEAELRGERDRSLAAFKEAQGRQLGYPPCCIAFFRDLGNLRENRPALAAAAAASPSFDARLSNTVLSVYHHVSWYPCRYDCAASLSLADEVVRALGERRPASSAGVRRFLAMPRIFLTDRVQLLLDGSWQGAEFHVEAVHTPYAFDRRADQVMLQWLLLADLGEELRAQGRIDGRGAWPERAVWLPFRDGGGAEAPRSAGGRPS